MATTAGQNPTYTPPVQTEGPFGVQGQQPGAPLSSMRGTDTRRTAPSNTLLWAALGAAGASLLLRTARRRNAPMFLAPLLLYGFKKMVKRGSFSR